MSTLSVRFPDSVHNAVKTYAKEDDISINQFVISAVIEKLTALDTARALVTSLECAVGEEGLELVDISKI